MAVNQSSPSHDQTCIQAALALGKGSSYYSYRVKGQLTYRYAIRSSSKGSIESLNNPNYNVAALGEWCLDRLSGAEAGAAGES